MMRRNLAVFLTLFVFSTAACDGDNGPGDTCGDGVINGRDVCDRDGQLDVLGGMTCQELGFVGGELTCSSSCLFDTTACSATCGNGVLDPSEACEGDDLQGNDCTTIDLNFKGGTLGCLEDCRFDTTACVSAVCGDSSIDGVEVCDGTDLRGRDCTTICVDDDRNGRDDRDPSGDTRCALDNFKGGTLACGSDCLGYDVSDCEEAVCGDGVLEGGLEVCDGTNLDGFDCLSLDENWTGGTLACDDDCFDFDRAMCTESECGDGIVEVLEICDGSNLMGNDCTTIGENFKAGTLACAANCRNWNTDGCTPAVCGDGVVEGLEVCDGSALAGESCVSQGLAGGNLVCAVSGCAAFDYSSCTCNPTDLGTWGGVMITSAVDSCTPGNTTYGNAPVGCAGDADASGEDVVYALTVPDTMSVRVIYIPASGGDAVLYALTDCTDTLAATTCGAGANNNGVGAAETIELVNETGGSVTYNIVADTAGGSTCGNNGTLTIVEL